MRAEHRERLLEKINAATALLLSNRLHTIGSRPPPAIYSLRRSAFLVAGFIQFDEDHPRAIIQKLDRLCVFAKNTSSGYALIYPIQEGTLVLAAHANGDIARKMNGKAGKVSAAN